jgi:hypothetical protein
MYSRHLTIRGNDDNDLHSAVQYCKCATLGYTISLPEDDIEGWILTIRGTWNTFDTQTLSLYGTIHN